MSTPQEIALERYVREAKGLSALPGIRWDDMVWVLQANDSTVSQRSHKSQSKSLWFTKLMPKGKRQVAKFSDGSTFEFRSTQHATWTHT